MGANYLGAALSGMASGYQQAQQAQQDLSFQQQARALQLQQMQTQNQLSQADLQTKLAAMSDSQYLADIAFKDSPGGVNPGQNTQPSATVGDNSVDAMGNYQPGGANAPTPLAGPNKPQPSPAQPGYDPTKPISAGNFPTISAAQQTEMDKVRLGMLQDEYNATDDPKKKDAIGAEIKQTQAKLSSGNPWLHGSNPDKVSPIVTPPARAIENKADAGQPVSAPELKSAADAQLKQATDIEARANKAYADGHPKVALQLREQAMEMRKAAIDYKAKESEITEKQNKDLARVVAGMEPENLTQEQYKVALEELRENPLFQKRAQAIGLTGQIDQDRNKIAQMQRQTMTLDEQAKIAAKKSNDSQIAANRKLDQEKKSLEIEKLRQEEQQATAMSPETLMRLAEKARTNGGALPELSGMSKGMASARIEVQNMITELDKRDNIPPEERAQRDLVNKATGGALNQLTKQSAQVNAFEKTATMNADAAVDASDKVSRSSWQSLNRIWQGGKEELSDPDAIIFKDYVDSFTAEYAKVMTGGGPGGVTSDAARAKSAELLTKTQDKDSFKKTVDALKAEMGRRTAGFDSEEKALLNRVAGKPAESKPAKISKPPSVGDIKDGYRYKGGDDGSDPNNWEKI